MIPAEPSAVEPSQPAPAEAEVLPATRWRTARGWARDLLISVLVSFFIILFVYQPVKVEGSSMEPGLEDQERIFVNKLVYRLENIARGDIVVFRYPRDPRKSFINRVIGGPGDHVRIFRGHADERSCPEIVVPPNSYFVLGDHRSMSNDSRDFGPVGGDYIYGKAVFGYWPMEKLGLLH